MRSALSIVLAFSVASGATPATAAEPGPIARAIEREAVRLAAQQSPPSPSSTRSRSSGILKDTLIGAGIGAGAAALMGYGVCSYCDDRGQEALVFAAGGAGVGALTGAIVGALGGRDPIPVFSGPNRRDVAPGTEVIVGSLGAAPVRRVFVRADDVNVVVRTDDTQIVESIPRVDLEAGRTTMVTPGSKGMGLLGRILIGTGVGFFAGAFTGAALCIGRCGG